MLFYIFVIKMDKKYKINGKNILCREVPYYDGNHYSVAVYVDDEYIGQMDKMFFSHSNFDSELKEFVKSNA